MAKEVVPKRLLTKEQLDWTERYKQAKRMAAFAQREPITMQRLFEEAMGRLESLVQNIPRRRIKELAQQPTEEE